MPTFGLNGQLAREGIELCFSAQDSLVGSVVPMRNGRLRFVAKLTPLVVAFVLAVESNGV